MKSPVLSPESFETKLDAFAESLAEFLSGKMPDGALRTVQRIYDLRRELIEHDAALRTCPEWEKLKLDEAALGLQTTDPFPEARLFLKCPVCAHALHEGRCEEKNCPCITRKHLVGCTLPELHVGACAVRRSLLP